MSKEVITRQGRGDASPDRKTMDIQTIWISDKTEGKLRCKTCEQLYASNSYARLVRKGCGCGRQFEFASPELEIRARTEFNRIIGEIASGKIDTIDDDDLPF